MNKKILLITAFFCFLFFNAQMVVKKSDGTVITDGSVFSYNSVDTDESILHFVVYNTATNDIKVRVLCESITNSDGSDFEFCFGGNCMPFVIVGQNYPPSGFTLPAGSNSGDGDHFWNKKAVSTTGLYPMNFVFKFYQIDAFGNQIGSPVRITYKSLENLTTNEVDFNKYGISLKSTLINDNIELNAKIAGNIYLFDSTGKLVTSKIIYKGENKINVSQSKSGIYILNFEGNDGKIGNIKLIKK